MINKNLLCEERTEDLSLNNIMYKSYREKEHGMRAANL